MRALRNPSGTGWLNPDLFWFVATDVDFWSVHVAGRNRFVEQVAESVPTRCSAVELDAHIHGQRGQTATVCPLNNPAITASRPLGYGPSAVLGNCDAETTVRPSITGKKLGLRVLLP